MIIEIFASKQLIPMKENIVRKSALVDSTSLVCVRVLRAARCR